MEKLRPHWCRERLRQITLKDNETAKIFGLSETDEYTITEASYADDGYTTTIDNVKTSTTAGTIATGAGTTADNGDKNITVVNDKTTNSPTGIFLHVAPVYCIDRCSNYIQPSVLQKKTCKRYGY